MGINRIRLQNGAMGDPRVDARMQQTYQQNIADNQAQQARNEGIFQAARDKLQGFGNTLTSGVQAGVDRAQNIFMNQAPNRFIDYLSGRTEPVTNLSEIASTQSTRDAVNQGILGSLERNQVTNPMGAQNFLVKNTDYDGYKLGEAQKNIDANSLTDFLLKAAPSMGSEIGQFADTMLGNPQNQIANTLGDYTFQYKPPSYDFDDDYMGIKDKIDFPTTGVLPGSAYDVNVELTDADTKQKIREQLFKDAAEPSAMPQGSPGQLNPTPTPDAGTGDTIITEGDSRYRINADGSRSLIGKVEDAPLNAPLNRDGFNKFFSTGNSKDYENYLSNFLKEQKVADKNNQLYYGPNQKPTMADVAGPGTSSLKGPENLKNYPDATDRIEVWDPIDKTWTSIGMDSPENRVNAAEMRADIAAKLGGEQGRKYLEQYADEQNLASGGRVGFQDGTDPNLTARQVAEQNPELNTIREQLFGENYLDDIDQGTGIAQYYTGFGQMPTLDYTPAAVDTSTPAVDVTQPVVDTGGGGGGGSDIDITTPDTGNTDFEQGLIDQGIGVQASPGDPVGAAFEEQLTQQAIDELADYPLNTSYGLGGADGMSGGQATPGVEFADQNPYGGTGTMDDLGADSFPEYQEPTIANLGSTAPGITDYLEGIDPATGLIETIDTRATEPPSLGFGNAPEADIYQDPIMGMANMNQADVIASDANVGFDTPEQTNAINEAFNSVKDLGAAGVGKLRDSLVALGGKVKEGFENTVEIGGKTIDLGKSLIGGALSLATGIPGVGFALNAIKEDPVDTYNQSLFSADDYLNSDIYKADKDMTDQEYSEYKNRLGSYSNTLGAGNLPNQDPFGKNITSMFGDYEAMAQNIVDELSAKPYNELSQFQKDQLDFYGDVVKDTPAPQEDIGATDSLSEFEAEDKKEKQKAFADIQNQIGQSLHGGDDNKGPEEPGDTSDGGFGNTEGQRGGNPYGGGSGGVQSGLSSPDVGEVSSDAGFSGPPSQSGGGGGGGGGGGKIVCTMMNESYGFGSFRNKIWLKHSKNLASEYQIGYHKIFLPLVKLSKTNKVLKKTLEHIAVHRTIDIRQEARGKMHLLGRIYRKILEPICYVVGKYAK